MELVEVEIEVGSIQLRTVRASQGCLPQAADDEGAKELTGVLPEQPDPTIFHRVLDVGCGSGSWLIQAAKTYPTMTTLVGADINIQMIEYARGLAQEQGVSDCVEFHVMDSLRMLEFPRGYFDLVNHRMGFSYLRTWDWAKLLQEFQRVSKPGGVIRITECDTMINSNSSALTRLCTLLVEAFYRAGHFFTPEGAGVTNKLAHLLHQYGIENVQMPAPMSLAKQTWSSFVTRTFEIAPSGRAPR